jgi:arginyl-tRNA synthetase
VIQDHIENRLQAATLTVLPSAEAKHIRVQVCSDPARGDYQSNAVMAIAKQLQMDSRQLATEIVSKLDVSDLCEPVEIAGPGFLNFRLQLTAVNAALNAALASETPFLIKTTDPRTVVIDFSSPNVAKPMHVGHIRSTILGDSLARIFRLLGHKVIADNHIGDWGTQFGMLLLGWKTQLDEVSMESDPISELERLYKLVNSDDALREDARAELVKLQQGGEENLSIWKQMIALSKQQFDQVYGRLGIEFDRTLGESFYNPFLVDVVRGLADNDIAEESDGAMAVFFPKDKQLADKPAIVRKRDGAANYMTTDLATLVYRMNEWSPDEIIYVTDGRQQLHFKQLFNIFRRWKPGACAQLEHVWFGSILGTDGKPFKARSGDSVRLVDLLNESEERAFKIVSEKNPDLEECERRNIARVVGLGALKYADLSNNRQSDYVFNWDKMLALQGNTAPYLQYAYTRIRSIDRKADCPDHSQANISLNTPEELALAKHLMNFGQVLKMITDDHRPNFLCNYLYELAAYFSRFYEACPVLKAEGEKESRLALCELTARVLRQGLDALGIEVTEVM